MINIFLLLVHSHWEEPRMLIKITDGSRFPVRSIVLNGVTCITITKIGLIGFGHATNYFIIVQILKKLAVIRRKMVFHRTVGKLLFRTMPVISGFPLRQG